MVENRPYRQQAIKRVEDPALVRGEGLFVGDIRRDGLLHAAFVRSTEAHGTITGIDLDETAAASGVVAVLTADDFDIADSPAIGPVKVDGMLRPALARDTVRYVGEAVAVVIAETQAQAVDAADLAWIDIDPLPAVMTVGAALEGDVLLFPEFGSNVAERFVHGDAAEGWDHPVDVSVTIHNQRLAPVPIETLSALADPTGDGGIILYVGHQMPHVLKRQLRDALGLDIEVVVPDVGGGFGLKGRPYPEYPILVSAAYRLGRPIRWLQTRREHMACGTHGRDMTHTMRIAGDQGGRIRRLHIDMSASLGAYPHTSAQVPAYARLTAQGMYDIEQYSVTSTSVVTNMAPTAPYRGAGRPESAYAIERAVEAFATATGLDPIEVRRKNLVGSFPYRSNTGALYDSGDYEAVLSMAVELVGLDDYRAEQVVRREAGQRPLGVGFGAFVERAGGPIDSGEYASTELADDGSLIVRTGSTPNGQGHHTVWAQVASQVFDVDVDRVRVITGDTAQIADGFGSVASRSAQIGASGVWRTAHTVLDLVKERAAVKLEASVSDLVIQHGVISVVGVPGVGVPMADIAADAAEAGEQLASEEFYSPHAQTFPNGVHVAVVEVDTETGEVDLIDFVAVDDCGNVLNQMIVDGQTHGSVAQGLGQALYEEVRYDESGQLLSSTLMDYSLPRASDMPPLRLGRVFSPAPSNPLGAKGSGEGGCIGAPPAIVNAVLDALRPLGVSHIDMPLKPFNVWQAIQLARR